MEDLPGMFFGRPISLGIIALTLLSLFYPLLRERLRRRRGIPTREALYDE
jgi:putative tricarboxylic transport membrane protein